MAEHYPVDRRYLRTPGVSWPTGRPSYVVVHYAPDVATGLRLPLGVLVELDTGAVVAVKQTPRPFWLPCLGGKSRALAVHLHDDFGLRGIDGPSVLLGSPTMLPRAVDPVPWVTRHVVEVRRPDGRRCGERVSGSRAWRGPLEGWR